MPAIDEPDPSAVGAVDTALGPVRYTRVGHGPAVVLLHGNPGDARDWDAVAGPLARHRTVVRVDWPGYGRSPAPGGTAPAGAPRYARVLDEVLDGLERDGVTGGRVVLVGHSVGGFAAVRAALSGPHRVAALVLVAPGGFTRFNPLTRRLVRLMGTVRVARRLAGPFAAASVVRRTAVGRAVVGRARSLPHRPDRLAVYAAVWRSFLDPAHDLRRDARRLAVPVLLVWGRLDPVVPWLSDGRRAARLLPGARVARVWSGHLPHAEAPHDWLAAVVPFLDAVQGTGRRAARGQAR